jgi:hypothetical protein
MKILRVAALIVFAMLAVFTTAQWGVAGDAEVAVSSIPEGQLNAYIEITRMMSEQPQLTSEQKESLCKEHQLTSQEYDKIDKQVQASPELKKSVEERLGKAVKAGDTIQEHPEVKTKLKQPEEK